MGSSILWGNATTLLRTTMTTVLIERLLDVSNDLTSFAADDKFPVLIAFGSITCMSLFHWPVSLKKLSPSVSIWNLARPGAVAGFLRWSPDAFAVAVAAARPHWPETRQHFRPMRLFMPLTVRKDDRELMSINAHDA